jgi:hypothetical protein
VTLNPDEPLLKIEDQTVRERVRVSIGGDQICIRLSNEYGSLPLPIGSVTVATPNDAASVRLGSIQSVSFGGRTSITVPAGAPVVSDPIAFPVISGAEISISLYFPKRVATPTLHGLALKRAIISQHGDILVRKKSKLELCLSHQSHSLLCSFQLRRLRAWWWRLETR